MKKLYFYALALVGAATVQNLHSYSVNFTNETDQSIFVQAQAKFTISHVSPNYSHRSKSVEYTTTYQSDKSEMKFQLEPGQSYSFNYVKTGDVHGVNDFSFSINTKESAYAIPEYTCNSKHNKSIYNKIMHGKHWYSAMPENPSVTIKKDHNGKITVACKAK